MAQEYDVVILGGGTGGYVAAIRASQLGLKTALVEKGALGGTCLHRGCIPSKALLKSAEVYQLTKQRARQYGVETTDTILHFSEVQQRKNAIVQQLYQGVQGLIKKGKIDLYEGTGRMLGPSIFSPMPGTISVEMNNGHDNEMLVLKHLIIATGSRPKPLPGLMIDEQQILSSDGALVMETLPTSILIVGGGVIGVEWASMLTDFEVDVTIVEFADRLLPTEDEDVSKEMKKQLEQRGVRIFVNAKALPETVKKTDHDVTMKVDVQGTHHVLTAEKMLVSIGRQANIEDIGIENTDIQIENGFIQTNRFYQTKERHIYAIGDVIGGLQLAHVASHEGIAAVEHIAGLEPTPVKAHQIARCVYSYPEVASIGLTTQQAQTQGYQTKIGKFPFAAIGKALVNGHTSGFVKIIVDAETDDLLGVHMIGSNVTELISEASLAMLLDATPWEIASSIHPHPSLSEIIGEAALAVDGRAIHY